MAMDFEVLLFYRYAPILDPGALVDSTRDLCEEFDGFVFNRNEAQFYEWIEEYDPPLFRRIARLVASGQWHVMGGWYLQPDCNLAGGESYVRQALIGKAYFRSRFGVERNG